jgi:N6-adenosine-specific RNA methylase IME4
MTVETPNTVHGRLLESAHIAGYTFKRAWDELKWLLDDERWQQLGFPDGEAFVKSVHGLFAEFKGTIEQKRDVVERLKSITDQRTIAGVLGVSQSAISRGFSDAGASKREKETAENKGLDDRLDAGASYPAFAIDLDPYAAAKRAERQANKYKEALENASEVSKSNAALPTVDGRKYGVIYADPPWNFEAYSGKGDGRHAKMHYPTMSLDEIKALPVAQLAADDCALFIWVLMPMLPHAFDVIKAWGFNYSTCAFVWVKQNKSGEGIFTGLGKWTRANVELCLLATMGSPHRLNADVHQVIMTPIGEHSAKPDEAASKIERLVAGPYFEMFSRSPRAGWDAWGNQASEAA